MGTLTEFPPSTHVIGDDSQKRISRKMVIRKLKMCGFSVFVVYEALLSEGKCLQYEGHVWEKTHHIDLAEQHKKCKEHQTPKNSHEQNASENEKCVQRSRH